MLNLLMKGDCQSPLMKTKAGELLALAETLGICRSFPKSARDRRLCTDQPSRSLTTTVVQIRMSPICALSDTSGARSRSTEQYELQKEGRWRVSTRKEVQAVFLSRATRQQRQS